MASKYKKNKAKFKWTKELVFLIVAMVAIIVVTIVLSIPSSKQKLTTSINEAILVANNAASESSSATYNYLPEDNVFEDASHEKLVDKVKSEEYVYVLYGSVNSTTILEQISTINTTAQSEEIGTVYFYSSLWVEETEDLESATFKQEKSSKENELNENKSKDVEEFSLLEYPALLVFHNGSLIFNSQQYDNSEYTWAMYIQKALFISKSNE